MLAKLPIETMIASNSISTCDKDELAGCITDYTTKILLDTIFGRSVYTIPPLLYFGLSLTSSNRSGIVSEPVGGGYIRVQVSNSFVTFSTAMMGAKSNIAGVVFPEPIGDWGSVGSLFIADSQSSGNVLAMADLAGLKSVKRGSAPIFIPPGGLRLFYA